MGIDLMKEVLLSHDFRRKSKWLTVKKYIILNIVEISSSRPEVTTHKQLSWWESKEDLFTHDLLSVKYCQAST